MSIIKFIKNLINKNGCKTKIRGINNVVDFPEKAEFDLKIIIYGDNNFVKIKTKGYYSGRIYIGTSDCPVSGSSVVIGEDTTSNGTEIWLLENNSSVIIGKEVMFSDNIYIACSDTHSIIDENGKLLNIGKSIEIGNHCWIGKYVRILKNTKIADNSIVALGSIVTKSFDETNVVLAGNPAKIVKTGVNWDKERPNKYMDR